MGALASSPWMSACKSSGVSGEVLGTYAVTGTIAENTCAPGFSPPDPLSFRVVLAEDQGQISWRVGDAAPASGTLAADGRFALRTSVQVVAWPPDAARMVVGCTLSQTETVTATFDSALPTAPVEDGAAAAPDAGVGRVPLRPYPGFGGEELVEVDATADSDCAALLRAGGGAFPSLPCHVRYRLTGTRLP